MSARRRANPGRVDDVGRAPSPAAFAVAVDCGIFPFPLGHAVADE